MNINVCRIDDRLIHGQIVTKWIKEANAKMILVSDDKAASDKMLQTILKLAVPSGISNEIIYIFLTIFLYLLKCPQSLIL